jgi:RPA family protein
MRERLTAIRASVSDIIEGTFGKDSGPYVTSPHGVELRRVALVGFIMDRRSGDGKGGGKYANITFEDDTGTINIWAWDQDAGALEALELNSLILVVGKVKSFDNEEIYILPDFIRELDDPNFMTLHTMERHYAILRLGNSEQSAKTSTKKPESQQTLERSVIPSQSQAPLPAEQMPEPTEPSRKLSKLILKYLRDNQKPEGVRIEEVVAHFLPKGYSKVDVSLEVMELQEQGLLREIVLGSYTLVEE